jgi:hypothetical protein
MAGVAVVVAAGCHFEDISNDPGDIGQPCLPNGDCLGPLECNDDNICELPQRDASFLDAPFDPASCPATDEPNDSIAGAKPISAVPATISNLGICSFGDIDTYRVTTTQVSTITARTQSVVTPSPVFISIGDAAGTKFASGAADTTTSIVSTYANAPAGDYYIELFGNRGQLYTLTVDVTAP